MLSYVGYRRERRAGLPSFALGGLAALSLCACERPPATPADLGPAQPLVEYVTRQQILTELPMRVRLPPRYGAEHVLVFVHLWGMPDWQAFELTRRGQTWEGAVSCRAVSTVTGDTEYYFLALDERGEPVVGSGSPEWPHVATVVRELLDGPQGLSSQAPPAQCHDPADCPPDFPGCPAYTTLRPTCRTDADCRPSVTGAGGRCEWDGYCDASEPNETRASEPEALAAAVRKAIKRARTAKADTKR
jgi:hypothetical protein